MSAVAVAAAAQGPAPPVPAGAVWTDIGASLTTYLSAAQFCTTRGLGMCCYNEYCPGGDGSTPAGGMKNSDEWAPTKDQANWW